MLFFSFLFGNKNWNQLEIIALFLFLRNLQHCSVDALTTFKRDIEYIILYYYNHHHRRYRHHSLFVSFKFLDRFKINKLIDKDGVGDDFVIKQINSFNHKIPRTSIIKLTYFQLENNM